MSVLNRCTPHATLVWDTFPPFSVNFFKNTVIEENNSFVTQSVYSIETIKTPFESMINKNFKNFKTFVHERNMTFYFLHFGYYTEKTRSKELRSIHTFHF